MSSKKLSLSKIIKFATENGFQVHKIYKIRGSVRFLLLTDENEDILTIEIPAQYTVEDKQSLAQVLRTSKVNQNHENYWSIMNAKLTDNDLICCGNEDITVFTHDGETRGYTLSDNTYEIDEDEKSDEDSDDDSIIEIEKKAEKIIQKDELEKLKKRKKENPIQNKAKIIFQNEEGKELNDEELHKESITVATLADVLEEDEKTEVTEKSDPLKEKLIEISQLNDNIELNLGQFYLLVGLTEFYKNIDMLKKKLSQFSKTIKEEESAIRLGRLENITLTLASLHQTIQNSFEWYTKKEEESKKKLQKLMALYTKLKDVKSETKDNLRNELRQMIRKERRDMYTIRDLTHTLLEKLEEDVERITQRCNINE